MLLSEGVNVKIVQELLGHSSVLVTLDTYAHFSADLQNDAVSRLDTLLGTN
jgi:integrase